MGKIAPRTYADYFTTCRSGTGPFFGEKTHFADEPLAENLDLSPFPQRQGDSPL